MKIIERTALWLIDKFIYLLIGKKDFTPTPIPDDWPPDGSMHFLRFNRPIGSAVLPPNAVQYEFAANVGEDNPAVFALGQEIIFRLCDNRPTLAVMKLASEPPKRRRQKPVPSSGEIVIRFLRTIVPETSVVQKGSLTACLTAGYPPNLFSRYMAYPDMPYCFIDSYLFPGDAGPHSAEEGLLLIERGEFQADLYLDYGPNALNIVLDSKTLDITAVEKMIGDVCRSHDVLLTNSPTES